MKSEIRFDATNGDWIFVSPARSKRPFQYLAQQVNVKTAECPFCNVGKMTPKPIGNFNGIQIVPNLYPAINQETKNGYGFHYLVVLPDHNTQVSDLPQEGMENLIDAYSNVYKDLAFDPKIKFISVFNNYGKEAGASLVHPHSQIIASSVIGSFAKRSLEIADRYKQKTGECLYCKTFQEELQTKIRVIFENNSFVAFCPFAPQIAHEIRIIPKKHSPIFEISDVKVKEDFAQTLRESLGAIKRALGEVPYNFFIATAPCNIGKDYSYYHWSVRILPKTQVYAGFEFATGNKVVTTLPEESAKLLRK